MFSEGKELMSTERWLVLFEGKQRVGAWGSPEVIS